MAVANLEATLSRIEAAAQVGGGEELLISHLHLDDVSTSKGRVQLTGLRCALPTAHLPLSPARSLTALATTWHALAQSLYFCALVFSGWTAAWWPGS